MGCVVPPTVPSKQRIIQFRKYAQGYTDSIRTVCTLLAALIARSKQHHSSWVYDRSAYQENYSPFIYLFIILTTFHLHIVGVEGYCCIWSRFVTSHTVGLLWTRDQPVTETSITNTIQHSQHISSHATGGIRTCNPSKRVAADPRLRPRVNRDRLLAP
jgi:hypothetical protein